MARPRAGVRLVEGRWTAALPVRLGASRRIVFTSADRDPVQRWFDDGQTALARGQRLPDKALYRTGTPAGPSPVAQQLVSPPDSAAWWAGPSADHGHSLDLVFESWLHDMYQIQRRAQPERVQAITRMWQGTLSPTLARLGVTTAEQATNRRMHALSGLLAGQDLGSLRPPTPPAPDLDGLDGHFLVTKEQARTLAGLSRSQLHRWRNAKLLPGWAVDTDGKVRIPVSDLRRAHRATAEPTTTRSGLASGTAKHHLWIIREVLAYAQANGVTLRGDPMYNIRAVDPDEDVAITPGAGGKPPRAINDLALVSRVAAGLHPIHQMVLWLLRLLGARIGEAYGLLVADFTDFGVDHGGALVLCAQGGRSFLVRDSRGNTTKADRKTALKTDSSHRVIATPEPLAALLRFVIATFHTDPATGRVDPHARLIPGIRQHNKAGQSSFRAALARAAEAAAVDADDVDRLIPHDTRADLITTLAREQIDPHLRRRYVGHAGNDVHDRVYTLDPSAPTESEMAVWRPITKILEAQVDEDLQGELMVPTTVRFQLGRKHLLADRQAQIDHALEEVGWYQTQSDMAGGELLGAGEMAAEIGMEVKYIRRRMADGTIPSVEVRVGLKATRMTKVSDFQAWVQHRRSLRTLPDVAAELGLTYHQLYELVRTRGVPVEQSGKRGDLLLPADSVSTLAEHLAAHRATLEGSVTIAEAAFELGRPVTVIETALRRGLLARHPASTHRRRMVTRDSLETYQAGLIGATPAFRSAVAAVGMEQARRITGLTRPVVSAKVQRGELDVVELDRRQCVTIASLTGWVALNGDPAMSARLAAEVASMPDHAVLSRGTSVTPADPPAPFRA